MNRLTLLLFVALLPLSVIRARSVDDIPNVHVADRTRYVSNPDGVLSAAAVDSLDRLLGTVWANTTAEPVVVAVGSMPSDTDIDSYATAIFERWGIGKKDKDNGVLMVIARDDRKAVIRTGYGSEGVLPDIVCGRILRNEMFPRFKEGDFDGGTIAGVNAIARVMTDPQYADELRSGQANDELADDFDADEAFRTYLAVAAVLAAAMLLWVIVTAYATRRQDSVTRYSRIQPLVIASLIVTVFTLGMGLPALATAWLVRRRIRNRRTCSNCGTRMHKIDEVNDNAYLTPAQDIEEQLNSVDYDVWVCPNCRETDILPYENRASAYKTCPRCGAKAAQLVSESIVRQPGPTRKGILRRTYHCRNCGQNHSTDHELPATGAAAAPIIIGGLGGRGGFGGGGFSGGSFGGGFTGGGGASGGW